MYDQVMDILERSRYSVLSDGDDLEQVFRLRYECYRGENAILKNERRIMTDAYDESPHCIHVAVEMDDMYVAALRLHLISEETLSSPSLEVFPEVMDLFRPGQTILDPTRFVVHPEARRNGLPLHLAALRIPFLAAMHYEVDIALAAVRAEHTAFYLRYLGYESFTAPRPYLGLTKPLGLMTAKFKENRDRVLKRYPFFGPVDDVPHANIRFPSVPGVYDAEGQLVAQVA